MHALGEPAGLKNDGEMILQKALSKRSIGIKEFIIFTDKFRRSVIYLRKDPMPSKLVQIQGANYRLRRALFMPHTIKSKK
jgi:hypothetical protein